MSEKVMFRIFRYLVYLTLLTPFLVSKSFLFPFVTTKAFYFRIIIELALPFYLFLLIVNKKFRPNLKNPLNLLVIIFWAITLVTSLTGVNMQRSLWGNFERMGGAYYLLHLSFFYFYLVFMAQRSPKIFQFFLKLVLWVSAAIAVYSVFTTWGMHPIIPDPSLPGRASAFFGNPIYLGSFLVLPLFLTLWFFARAEKLAWKIVYFAVAFVEALSIFYSGTRGAAVGLVLGAVFASLTFLFFYKGKRKKTGIILVFTGFLAIGFAFFAATNVPYLRQRMRAFNLVDSNTESRILQWKVALEGYKDYPILGVGTENYYIVANKYYNPEISKYDKSWFDKPHNYVLEILVTTGIFGLLSYLGLAFLCLAALYKAYKKSLISLFEGCVLLAGFLAYQFQNLFVFDNVSSSLIYFVILAFAAFLWIESEYSPNSARDGQKSAMGFNFGASIFVVSFIVSAYLVYATNYVPGKISKNVNFGYAYASYDPEKSYEYFHTAASLPFNFDPGESGSKYAGSAINWAQGGAKESVAAQGLDESISLLEKAVRYQKNYPIFWIQLSSSYLVKSMKNGQNLPDAIDAAQKAIDLAPKRNEARQYLIRIRQMQNNLPEALKLAEENLQMYPDNPGIIWQEGQIQAQMGKMDEALKDAQEAFNKNFAPNSFSELYWLLGFYNTTNNISEIIKLYEKYPSLLSNDDYINLVMLYKQSGQAEKAQWLAGNIIKTYPDLKPKVEKALK
jgi:O-antigen ligase/tetratricopeptide (TPR) repeat protein